MLRSNRNGEIIHFVWDFEYEIIHFVWDFEYGILNTVVFEVPVGELMGAAAPKRKPGRASRLEQLTGELAKLPKSKQAVVVQMLEGFLQQESNA